jgi:hypothetical protein
MLLASSCRSAAHVSQRRDKTSVTPHFADDRHCSYRDGLKRLEAFTLSTSYAFTDITFAPGLSCCLRSRTARNLFCALVSIPRELTHSSNEASDPWAPPWARPRPLFCGSCGHVAAKPSTTFLMSLQSAHPTRCQLVSEASTCFVCITAMAIVQGRQVHTLVANALLLKDISTCRSQVSCPSSFLAST